MYIHVAVLCYVDPTVLQACHSRISHQRGGNVRTQRPTSTMYIIIKGSYEGLYVLVITPSRGMLLVYNPDFPRPHSA